MKYRFSRWTGLALILLLLLNPLTTSLAVMADCARHEAAAAPRDANCAPAAQFEDQQLGHADHACPQMTVPPLIRAAGSGSLAAPLARLGTPLCAAFFDSPPEQPPRF